MTPKFPSSSCSGSLVSSKNRSDLIGFLFLEMVGALHLHSSKITFHLSAYFLILSTSVFGLAATHLLSLLDMTSVRLQTCLGESCLFPQFYIDGFCDAANHLITYVLQCFLILVCFLARHGVLRVTNRTIKSRVISNAIGEELTSVSDLYRRRAKRKGRHPDHTRNRCCNLLPSGCRL